MVRCPSNRYARALVEGGTDLLVAGAQRARVRIPSIHSCQTLKENASIKETLQLRLAHIQRGS